MHNTEGSAIASDTRDSGYVCDSCGEPMTARLDDPARGNDSAMDLVCPNGHEVYVPAESPARTRIAKLREINRSGMAARVEGCLVDIQTANLLVQVFDKLSRDNKAKFAKPSLPRLVDFAWKQV